MKYSIEDIMESIDQYLTANASFKDRIKLNKKIRRIFEELETRDKERTA